MAPSLLPISRATSARGRSSANRSRITRCWSEVRRRIEARRRCFTCLSCTTSERPIALCGQLLVQGNRRALFLTPEQVHGQVVRHPVKPTFQPVPGRAPGMRGIQQPEEYLAGQVLSLGWVTEQTIEIAIDRRGVAIIDLGQGRALVVSGSLQQQLIGRRQRIRSSLSRRRNGP